jgi:hypothetical protein
MFSSVAKKEVVPVERPGQHELTHNEERRLATHAKMARFFTGTLRLATRAKANRGAYHAQKT